MALQQYTFANNASGRLDIAVASGDTTLELQTDEGAAFGSPSATSLLILTIVQYNDMTGTEDQAIASGVNKFEIVTASGRTTDTITGLTRAQESTTAKAFDQGSYVYARLTAKHMQAIFGAFEITSEASGDFLVSNGTKFQNKKFIKPVIATLTDAATITVDVSLGNMFKVTLAGNRTMGNPTNAVDGHYLTFRINQDATGGRTLAWDTNYSFGSAGAPTISSTSSATTYVSFRYDDDKDKWHYMGAGLGY